MYNDITGKWGKKGGAGSKAHCTLKTTKRHLRSTFPIDFNAFHQHLAFSLFRSPLVRTFCLLCRNWNLTLKIKSLKNLRSKLQSLAICTTCPAQSEEQRATQNFHPHTVAAFNTECKAVLLLCYILTRRTLYKSLKLYELFTSPFSTSL